MTEGKAAITFDDKMVDVPVYKRALNTLARADAIDTEAKPSD